MHFHRTPNCKIKKFVWNLDGQMVCTNSLLLLWYSGARHYIWESFPDIDCSLVTSQHSRYFVHSNDPSSRLIVATTCVSNAHSTLRAGIAFNAWKRMGIYSIVRFHTLHLASSLNYPPIQDLLVVHGRIRHVTLKLLCSYTGEQTRLRIDWKEGQT